MIFRGSWCKERFDEMRRLLSVRIIALQRYRRKGRHRKKREYSRLKGNPNFPSSPSAYQTHGRKTRTGYSRIRLWVRHPGCPCRHSLDIVLSEAPRLGDFHIGCLANRKLVGHQATMVGRLYSQPGGPGNDARHNPESPRGS